MVATKVRVYYCGEQIRGYTTPDSDEELKLHPTKLINEIEHDYIDMDKEEFDKFKEENGRVNICKLHKHLKDKK